MKLQMHSIHFVADQKLIDFIQRKADKLDTYYDQIIDGEVFMRLDKNNKSENKIVEIKLNEPG
ncbi:MAG: HPF/RaiA family ribosome-associated protein, partial [Cyclobacteriaceae bacterium]